MKRSFICTLALFITANLTACTSQTTKPIYAAGIYEGKAQGFGGEVAVKVEVDSTKIKTIEALSHQETEGIGASAIEQLTKTVAEKQTTQIDAIGGATISSKAFIKATENALARARGEEVSEEDEIISTGILINLDTINTSVAGTDTDDSGQTTYDKGWTVQPKIGITKGDYYKMEELFRQGHISTLEVVMQDDHYELIEFNETTRPNYYTRLFANVPKRMSEYNFDMGEKEGAAWIQGIILAENQMMENQDLKQNVDLVSGASISVKNSFMPMAAKMNDEVIPQGTTQKYYSIAETLGGGLTGKLDLVIDDGKIIECRYDEIFADEPEQIEDYRLKKYYRQSKYQSVLYVDSSRLGFAYIFDALNEHVIETQDLFDIKDMPAAGAEGDFAKTGFTDYSPSWDNYLKLAQKLHDEMTIDKVLY